MTGRRYLEHVSARLAAAVVHALGTYAATLNAGQRRKFERYRPVDVAFKLVGTGGVGTRDYVILLFGNGPTDPLFIQVKQELPSCYAPYPSRSASSRHQGRRVAEGQQMMQTLSDPFLGYTGFSGHEYWSDSWLITSRHSIRLISIVALFPYATLCGEVLAKGHARSGDAALLAGYAGRSPRLDRAIAAFAVTYAEQVQTDYKLFRQSQHPKPR